MLPEHLIPWSVYCISKNLPLATLTLLYEGLCCLGGREVVIEPNSVQGPEALLSLSVDSSYPLWSRPLHNHHCFQPSEVCEGQASSLIYVQTRTQRPQGFKRLARVTAGQLEPSRWEG